MNTSRAMALSRLLFSSLVLTSLLISTLFISTKAFACGGFFCQLTPINQAAEQIVFRQQGSEITAMVQIQFEGEAEDFSWVVPVPSTPTYKVGSNQVFTDLDLVTRPQFRLQQNGSQCASDDFIAFPTAIADADGSVAESADGVVVEDVQDVGGYTVTLISGEDAQSVSDWLIENDYDLTSRGQELLTPYVEDGMKFVAVKLQQNRGLGSIQPLIMTYQSDKPVVPIRLTAVAAIEDMGVQVWLLGDGRAVPENYLHVIPNYTRLDWFSANGANAYPSYQSLITEAMNEAGGQGFATDYAGRFPNIYGSLTSRANLEERLNQLSSSSDVEFLTTYQRFFSDAIVTETIANALPLADGVSPDSLFDRAYLAATYTADELAQARSAVQTAIRTEIMDPLQDSLNVLGGGLYMTRLSTTLSADEMTVDPAFVFNSDMPDQPLERTAVLNMECVDETTNWSLTLGAGTERVGEVVIEAVGPVPFFNPMPVLDQQASYRLEATAVSGLPDVRTVRSFGVASRGEDGNWEETGADPASVRSSSGGGAFGLPILLLVLLGGLLLTTFRLRP